MHAYILSPNWRWSHRCKYKWKRWPGHHATRIQFEFGRKVRRAWLPRASRCTVPEMKLACMHHRRPEIIIVTITLIIIIIIITTRPKPAYGPQGLANVLLRASGTQLGNDDFSLHINTQTLHHNIYIINQSSSPPWAPGESSWPKPRLWPIA